jgi:acyl-CoA-dependent ceramide synthase
VLKYGFLTLLMALQVLTLIWFGMIVKVAYNVITGKGAQDSRSDDEGLSDDHGADDDAALDEFEEENEDEVEVVDPVLEQSPAVLRHRSKERERSVEEPRKKASHATTKKQTSPPPAPSHQSSAGVAGKSKGKKGRGARTSGISIPGHGDHKELLGRIGCDKPS